MEKISRKVKTVLEILDDEIRGDIDSALKKMTRDYTMTWVYVGKRELFPATKIVKKEMQAVYPVRGRKYDIKNIAEGNNVVMVELVESYPDTKIKKVYRTPMVLVLEFSGNKIKTGRHYCDPRLSYLHLSTKQIKKIFK
ncbi:MAG: hypothetical protein UT32_C0013G0028 [Parcubacteria group bacterium GW2011_GWC2_39_14]|nr:MAG: hypothetical protein UT32_C0013G0028 [Parcubacteria group bacterium GW2011_GWC2_39_14]KKR54516.1 MAG: hypothetical protein UT91_C0014G0028 [Parcubacteria group bacterium GW2011_GWA2_40_23]